MNERSKKYKEHIRKHNIYTGKQCIYFEEALLRNITRFRIQPKMRNIYQTLEESLFDLLSRNKSKSEIEEIIQRLESLPERKEYKYVLKNWEMSLFREELIIYLKNLATSQEVIATKPTLNEILKQVGNEDSCKELLGLLGINDIIIEDDKEDDTRTDGSDLKSLEMNLKLDHEVIDKFKSCIGLKEGSLGEVMSLLNRKEEDYMDLPVYALFERLASDPDNYMSLIAILDCI